MFRKDKARAELKTLQAYQRLFASPDGDLVLQDLARKCYVLDPVASADGKDISLFNDGKRAAFIDIINMLKFDEQQIIKFLKGKNND